MMPDLLDIFMDMNRLHVNSIGGFTDWRCGYTRYHL